MWVLLKLFHVLAAMLFIAGLLGRNLTLAQARRASDVCIVDWLMQLEARFDNLMVIPGSLAVLVLGLLTAWVAGYPIFGLLQGAHRSKRKVSIMRLSHEFTIPG